MADVCPFVQILDAPVLADGDGRICCWRSSGFWTQVPEQAIDVPKIYQDRNQQRLVDRDLRHAQMAEQLVEMVEFVQFASLLQQQRAEQIVDNPVSAWSSGEWWRFSRFSSRTEFSSSEVEADH